MTRHVSGHMTSRAVVPPSGGCWPCGGQHCQPPLVPVYSGGHGVHTDVRKQSMKEVRFETLASRETYQQSGEL